MQLDERELRTLDHLVKVKVYENEERINGLEDKFPDYVALYQNEIFQSLLSERDHLGALSCKILGDLMGVKVDIKLNRK